VGDSDRSVGTVHKERPSIAIAEMVKAAALPTICQARLARWPTSIMRTMVRPGADERTKKSASGPCDVPAQIHDERIQLMSLVARAYRHLADNLGRQLEQAVGISPVFFDVLIHVAVAPGSRLTMSRLSSQVALTKGGMTRLVDRMIEAGLVVRHMSSSDRRSIEVVLTKIGREVLKRAIAAHLESIDRHLVAPLNRNDRASLAVTLSKVLDREPFSDDFLYVR
jgi:DNA-binding MarR family transcriptional regulator